MEEQPDMPWHKIDQQLSSMSLHGINTINQAQHQPQHQGGRQQWQQQFWWKQDWPFWHCFDHSRGNCIRQSCSFPHIYGYCGSPNHTTYNCPTHQDQQQQYHKNPGQQPSEHKTCKGIPSTEQYIPPTPLRVEHLRVLLQHHPQQDRVCYVLNGLLNGFSLEYKGE